MEIHKDSELIIALSERNEKAFDVIFRKYFPLIYSFVYQNCKSKEEAEELTQDIFVKLWINSQKVQILSLKGYLYTIAKGVVIDWTRRKINQLVFEALRDDSLLLNLVEQTSDEAVSREYLLSVIEKLAQSMPERRREVYRLRWIEGLSRKEIAHQMGISVTTVDIHLQKALEYLRTTISKTPDELLALLLFIYIQS